MASNNNQQHSPFSSSLLVHHMAKRSPSSFTDLGAAPKEERKSSYLPPSLPFQSRIKQQICESRMLENLEKDLLESSTVPEEQLRETNSMNNESDVEGEARSSRQRSHNQCEESDEIENLPHRHNNKETSVFEQGNNHRARGTGLKSVRSLQRQKALSRQWQKRSLGASAAGSKDDEEEDDELPSSSSFVVSLMDWNE